VTHSWKVVPLTSDQRRDINDEDIVWHGATPLYRRCLTYKGGGGYDKFPQYAYKRGLVCEPVEASVQFVVQLYGCNLDCPFCYVTRRGVWDKPIKRGTTDLVLDFLAASVTHGCRVFHLMGGAPALQLQYWPELLNALEIGHLFHSDLMLTEKPYTKNMMRMIDYPNALYAVNIKGLTPETFYTNTRKRLNQALLRHNLTQLLDFLPYDRWYLTFTNVPSRERNIFLKDLPHKVDWFDIDLIAYEAVSYVDNRSWGGQ